MLSDHQLENMIDLTNIMCFHKLSIHAIESQNGPAWKCECELHVGTPWSISKGQNGSYVYLVW